MTMRGKSAGRTSGTPGVYVALLRGINMGGKNKLPMKELCALFVELGCKDVRHYIQSGNVVFKAAPALAKQAPDKIAHRITERFGLNVPVILRSAGEMGEVAQGNPFLASGVAHDRVAVGFLAEAPDAARVALLDPDRSPPDQFVIHGREIYLCCPNGFGETKLNTNYFDSKLRTVSTFRNWKTVLTLLDMLAE